MSNLINNIKFEINQDIATITFDLKDEKINKLSFEILKEFDEKLDLVQKKIFLLQVLILSRLSN